MPADPPYMRCSKLDKLDKITYPAYVQRKADGMFVNIIVRGHDVTFMSRYGETFELPSHKSRFHLPFNDPLVFHGEVVFVDETEKELDRATSNGMALRLLKKNQVIANLIAKTNSLFEDEKVKEKELSYEEVYERARIRLWDVVDYSAWKAGQFDVAYEDRFGYLNGFKFADMLIDTDMANSEEEAIQIAKMYMKNGFEGAVVKNMQAGWKNHTSPNQVKIKAVEECDLNVIDCIEGKGKYKGMVGALLCESSDKRVVVEVGTGFTDKARGLPKETYVGRVVNVLYEKLTTNKNRPGVYSLSHPRFNGINLFSVEADDFERIRSKQKYSK